MTTLIKSLRPAIRVERPFFKLKERPSFVLKKEYLAIGLALLVFLLFPWLARRVDLTAAPIDAGALSAIIMAVLAVLVFKALTWWLIIMIWPFMADYSVNQLEKNFKSLPSWQKLIVFLVFYLLLFYAFILALVALL